MHIFPAPFCAFPFIPSPPHHARATNASCTDWMEPSNCSPLPSQPLKSILCTTASGILLNGNVLLYPFLLPSPCCSGECVLGGEDPNIHSLSHQSLAPSHPATPAALHTGTPALHTCSGRTGRSSLFLPLRPEHSPPAVTWLAPLHLAGPWRPLSL